MFRRGTGLAKALLVAGPLLFAADAMAEAIPVELKKTERGWQLLRGGEPYFIRGAGGTHSLQALAAAGANSIRTWDAEKVRGDDDVGVLLDEAHALGMTVTVGIWLGHERHGFDYSDPQQIASQMQRARGFVQRYKDHPALLLWGIGNEMEGFEEGDNPAVWEAVNDIAAMVKRLDPKHPTMTVTTFVHGERIEYVHRQSPAIDIHGVNAYGGAFAVHERLRAGGGSKPFVLTEFGPLGPWETPKTDWGAPYEQTSTEKAEFYGRSYRQGIAEAADLALGSYAFLWGNKMEATGTWFGMFLDDGARLGAVDVMTELWSGSPPADLAPVVTPLTIDGQATLDPASELQAHVEAADPEGEPLRARWVLRPESGEILTGGDFRPEMPAIDGAVLESGVDGARVRMPDEPGPYRLFYTVYDTAGNAATANLPLLVKGDLGPRLPVAVYDEGFENMPWVPSGWMGGTEQLTLDGRATQEVHAGQHSIRMRYEGPFGWAGVAWQHPANNWGDQDGGFDLTGASALELWARGEYGGEKVNFGVGLLEQDKAHPDSVIAKLDGIVLTRDWRRYRVPLKGRDLSSIKTGFVVTLTGRQTPVTIYLDGIRYIR
ncbi:MAG: glycoside hydrolase family 2 TIM barrel-domain containing protein [Pseudomonadota bacterium]